jgi:steroid 5-alpha reductase family enzyme
MNAIINALSFGGDSRVGVFAFSAMFTVAVVTAIWIIGLSQPSHSMIDGWYGFAYAVPAWIAFYLGNATSQAAAILLLMVTLHGGRLGYYLAARWRRYTRTYGGDPRYLRFVQELSPGYWWKSFAKVMEPQAVIIILIGSPAVWGVLASADSTTGIGPLTIIGILVFGVGLYFETVADAQLQAFLADQPHNEGRYLNTGVWTRSRHPNYFGTTTVWWGIWITAVGGNSDAWWTVIGPVINTIMLTKVLGTKFQDRYMGDRPEYQELIRRTRGFLPVPVSSGRTK